MSKTRIIRYALIVFLLLPLITFAEKQEMKEHKVIKGDTLWDITESELTDPFRWPEVWKVNPWIKNPHWIYPKQIIKIPLYLLKKEKLDEEVASKPAAESQETTTASQEPAKDEINKKAAQIRKYPIINRNLLMASGYIADTIPGVGEIGDSPSGQVIYGNEDIVYVSVDHPAKVGDKFYVIKALEPLEHPVTGKEIGYVISICGIAEIVKIKNGETMAKITKCFREIDKGDRLDPYYDIEPPMTTEHFRSPDINGVIVATGNHMVFQTVLDIVYIDKGCKDGIEAGDMFMSLAVDTHTVPNGLIRVINCRDHTATAIIEYSNKPVSPGNIFTKLENN
ncbi:MAG: LysM peptidoglycan-binding domain-containing protein [Deltaproteobacteria bacterium]|nr:LysM peptidoglycan-binding domain-containing protein [Deltaproteobacteria bacterium]